MLLINTLFQDQIVMIDASGNTAQDHDCSRYQPKSHHPDTPPKQISHHSRTSIFLMPLHTKTTNNEANLSPLQDPQFSRCCRTQSSPCPQAHSGGQLQSQTKPRWDLEPQGHEWQMAGTPVLRVHGWLASQSRGHEQTK